MTKLFTQPNIMSYHDYLYIPYAFYFRLPLNSQMVGLFSGLD